MIKIGKGHDHGIFLRLKEKFKIDQQYLMDL